MGDTDANMKVRLKEMIERKPIAGFRSWDVQGAEALRAAIDFAFLQERPKHFMEPWKVGDVKVARLVYDTVAEMMKNPDPLKAVAHQRGYHNHSAAPGLADPGGYYIPKAHSYVTRDQDNWLKSRHDGIEHNKRVIIEQTAEHRSKFANVPAIEQGYAVSADARRSTYESLPNPPMRNGKIDYEKLNEMAGHKRSTGTGASKASIPVGMRQFSR